MEQPNAQLRHLQDQRRTAAERSRHGREDLDDGGQSDGADVTAEQQVGRRGAEARKGGKERK